MKRVAVLLWLAACSTHHPSVAGGACHDRADCGDGERCDWDVGHACGADGGAGHCVAFAAAFCPSLSFEVCGCDGAAYTNQCFADSAGEAIDYGGPCRPAGTFVACATSVDCPRGDDSMQACIDDPRDSCTGASCPGLCVHAAYTCGATDPCASATSMSFAESPGTEACVIVIDAAAGDPDGRCVFTTRRSCTAPADCGAGELCVPAAAGDSYCVRP
ncbi:MAG TPA: hypothetical protein VGC42_16310 [Kofleriaceae bacterium]